MCKIIHGVCFPLGAGAVMRSLDYAVYDGVSEQHVVVSHVNLGTQYHGALFKLTAVHLVEQVQVFLYGAVAVRAVDARLGGGSFLRKDGLLILLVNIGLALLYKVNCKIPQLLEIV